MRFRVVTEVLFYPRRRREEMSVELKAFRPVLEKQRNLSLGISSKGRKEKVMVPCMICPQMVRSSVIVVCLLID